MYERITLYALYSSVISIESSLLTTFIMKFNTPLPVKSCATCAITFPSRSTAPMIGVFFVPRPRLLGVSSSFLFDFRGFPAHVGFVRFNDSRQQWCFFACHASADTLLHLQGGRLRQFQVPRQLRLDNDFLAFTIKAIAANHFCNGTCVPCMIVPDRTLKLDLQSWQFQRPTRVFRFDRRAFSVLPHNGQYAPFLYRMDSR